jgi:hypothetical protein
LNKLQPNKNSSRSKPSWPLVAKLLVVAVIIVLVPLLIADTVARQHFSVAYNEMERIRKEVIEPAGGVEHIIASGPNMRPLLKGNGFIESFGCSIDLDCPYILREWSVPIQPGKENNFAHLIMQKEGYQSENGYKGNKGNTKIYIYPINKTDVLSLPKAAEGRQWEAVTIEATWVRR